MLKLSDKINYDDLTYQDFGKSKSKGFNNFDNAFSFFKKQVVK